MNWSRIMTNRKTNSSASLSDSISVFTQSATKAFHDLQAEARVEVTRVEAENKRVKTERDQALKALQDSKKEIQKHKEEFLACRASLKEAELTIKQHVEDFTILQRETSQWRDQAKNWQEHFLRVEEERCSLASRLGELEAEMLAPPVAPKQTKAISSTSAVQQPPTYHSAVPSSSQIPSEHQQTRSPAKVNKRKAPSQSELPPYTETAQTPRTTKTAAAATSTSTSTSTSINNRSNRKQTGSTTSHPKKASSEVAEVSSIPQEPKQILIRRVHAVVEVKREEDSDEDIKSATPPESLEVITPRRSRNARRSRQIIDDDEYTPDATSRGIGSRSDDDDELMIAAGDDLSFEVGSPSVMTRASPATKGPSKRRKLNVTSNRTKRKT